MHQFSIILNFFSQTVQFIHEKMIHFIWYDSLLYKCNLNSVEKIKRKATLKVLCETVCIFYLPFSCVAFFFVNNYVSLIKHLKQLNDISQRNSLMINLWQLMIYVGLFIIIWFHYIFGIFVFANKSFQRWIKKLTEMTNVFFIFIVLKKKWKQLNTKNCTMFAMVAPFWGLSHP